MKIDKNDAWIEWHGGECPVDSDAIVEVRFRNKNQNHYQYNNDRAGDFDWAHAGSSSDIIAYRLHKPDAKSRANDDRLEQDLNECIGQDFDVPEWDGDGLPPVGTICEAKVQHSITGWEWREVKVVESGIPGAEKEVLVYDLETTFPSWADEFRPLRTEAEKLRESAINDIALLIGRGTFFQDAERIYDAISSGEIKVYSKENK